MEGEARTAGAVKEAVAGLDGVVDLVGAGVVVDLPQAEADERHLLAIVEGDCFGVRHGCVNDG